MKEILIVGCKCGRMKREGGWSYVSYSFSVFVSKMFARGNLFTIRFIQGKCPNCQKKSAR